MAASIPVKPATKDFLQSQKPDGVTWDEYLLSLAIPVADDVDPRDVKIAMRRLKEVREGKAETMPGEEFTALLRKRLKRVKGSRSG